MSPRKRQTAFDNTDESAAQQMLGFVSLSPVTTGDIESAKTVSDVKRQVYSVRDITRLIEGALSDDPVLGRSVVVEGELSNVKRSSRGHVYLTLKDGEAAIGGILWASIANRLDFEPMDGQAVYLTGKLEIYAPSGTYSLVGSRLEPVGIGALQLAFQQIKARLEAEGLFMDEFKQDLPDFPERIGIITSSTGAVIHDMLRVIRRKNPCMNVLLAPVKVQGEGAAQEIARAIAECNHPDYRLDALIVARGGGSFEDLFCFSEEPVVRAIFESRVPVVTGIGHEPDFSLADAVADYSASTPTAAADCLTPDIEYLREMHARCVRELLQGMAEHVLYYERTLDEQSTRLIERHVRTLDQAGNHLAQLREKWLSRTDLYFQQRAQSLAQTAATLDAFNPLVTLARGFAIATRMDGSEASLGVTIRSVKQARPGDTLRLRLIDGHLHCRILDVEEAKLC